MNFKKSFVFVLVLLLLHAGLYAQDLGNLMKKYGKNDNFEYVNVNKAMLVMARAAADKESRKVLNKISNMKLLSVKNKADAQPFLNEMEQLTQSLNFEQTAEVNEKGDKIDIYIKETKPGNSELLIVSNEKSGTINIALINGELTPEEYKSMSRKKPKDKNVDKE